MNRALYIWLSRSLERSPRLELALRWIIWGVILAGGVQILRSSLAR